MKERVLLTSIFECPVFSFSFLCQFRVPGKDSLLAKNVASINSKVA